MSPEFYEHLIQVKPEHIDEMNHVNNVVYLPWAGCRLCALDGKGTASCSQSIQVGCKPTRCSCGVWQEKLNSATAIPNILWV